MLPTAPPTTDEAGWEAIRVAQFPSRRIHLNPGHLGPTSTTAKQRVRAHDADELEFFPLGRMEAGLSHLMTTFPIIAHLWDAPGMEVMVSSGTTDAMNLLTLSLAQSSKNRPLKVLTTVLEHPGGVGGFQRHPAFDVAYLTAEEMRDVSLFERRADVEKPDIAFFSHLSYCSTETLPVAEWNRVLGERCCRVVDCAQSIGLDAQLPFAHADIVVASAHKWLFGPVGTGLLWFRPDARKKLLPLSWTGPEVELQHPLARYGFAWNQDPMVYPALAGALELYRSLTPRAIETRSQHLAKVLRSQLAEVFSRRNVVVTMTGEGGTFCADFTAFDPHPLYKALNQQGIHTKCIKTTLKDGRSMAVLRFGVPYYETIARLSQVVPAVDAFLGA